MKSGDLTARDVLGFRSRDLSDLTGAGPEEIAHARLRLLGADVQGVDDATPKPRA